LFTTIPRALGKVENLSDHLIGPLEAAGSLNSSQRIYYGRSNNWRASQRERLIHGGEREREMKALKGQRELKIGHSNSVWLNGNNTHVLSGRARPQNRICGKGGTKNNEKEWGGGEGERSGEEARGGRNGEGRYDREETERRDPRILSFYY
jgi:hypothetical protein